MKWACFALWMLSGAMWVLSDQPLPAFLVGIAAGVFLGLALMERSAR